MVYGWCREATNVVLFWYKNLHLAHEQRWVPTSTWAIWNVGFWMGSMGIMKWIEDGMIGEKPYGKTLLTKKCWDSPMFNRKCSWFQHWKWKRKTSMANLHEVIKVRREKLCGNKVGEKNGLPTPPKKVVKRYNWWHTPGTFGRRCVFLKVYEIWKL